MGVLPVENITHELQQKKAERLGRNRGATDATPPELPSGSQSMMDEDKESLTSCQSESYMHVSQTESSNLGPRDAAPRGSGKNKAQLWNDLKINSNPHPRQS